MILNRRQLELNPELNKVYQWLIRNNISLLNKILPLSNTKWTLEACKTIALKYKTRTNWSDNDRNSYRFALKKGWLKECCSHMKKKKIKNLDTDEIFNTAVEAELMYKLYRGAIGSVISDKQKTAGGYRWAYCDEKGNVIK